MGWPSNLANYLNKIEVVSTVSLGVTFWLTIDAHFWLKTFILASERPVEQIAAIGVVVMGPATMLAAYVFRKFIEARPWQ